MTPHTLPTPQQRREIAARAIMPERTIRRVYRGAPAKPSTIERISRAAAEIGAPLPPPRSEAA
jgi:hypothetical protein